MATRAEVREVERGLFDAREAVIATQDLAKQYFGADHPVTKRIDAVVGEMGDAEVDLHRMMVRLVATGAKRQTCTCPR
jgi:hypothetical protein